MGQPCKGDLEALSLLALLPPRVAGPVGQLGTYLILALALSRQLHLPAFWPATLGTLLNALVILANGGQMPVDPLALEKAGLGYLFPFLEEARDGVHTLAGSHTRLLFLGDWIAIPPLGKVVSPGDLFLALSLLLIPIFPRRPLGLKGETDSDRRNSLR